MPFKKIFKPIAKVLDKVIPNEIKPALPYLAAFAPVFGPAGVQSFIGSTMGRRALTSGLLNIGAQLSQEGSEGDINLLSAGLGALSGAMTTPGAAKDFRGARFGEPAVAENIRGQQILTGGLDQTGISTLERGTNIGLEGLAKGSDFLRPGGNIPNLFSKEGLKIATAPAATATGDVMQAQARQLEKQAAIDAALAEAEALADSGARAAAIRNAMNAYGFFTDEEIEETISAAGYKAGGRVGLESGGGLGALARAMAPKEDETFKFDAQQFMIDKYNEEGIQPEIIGSGFQGDDEIFIISTPGGGTMVITQDQYTENFGERKAKGGRVGFKFGGIDAAIKKVEDESIKESAKMVADMPDMDLMDLIEEFEIIFKRKPMNMEELKQFYRENYEMESPVRMKEKIKETVTVKAKDGGLMDLGGKEMDLRGGGFVPIGKKERADDVPARLSKNEFVMTADAVRAAGGGSVNEGAKRMYKVMNDLEARA